MRGNRFFVRGTPRKVLVQESKCEKANEKANEKTKQTKKGKALFDLTNFFFFICLDRRERSSPSLFRSLLPLGHVSVTRMHSSLSQMRSSSSCGSLTASRRAPSSLQVQGLRGVLRRRPALAQSLVGVVAVSALGQVRRFYFLPLSRAERRIRSMGCP